MTTLSAEVAEAVRLLRQQADEIANAGHNGWGNTMLLAADELERLHARVRELEYTNELLSEQGKRNRDELEQARSAIESWKRQSRANWEAARALATTATGYPRALSEHEQAAMDTLKQSP